MTTFGSPGDVIRTARLMLRPLRASDAEPLFALFANWDIVRWLDAPPWPYTLADADGFIRQQPKPNPDFTDTGLAITRDGELIGGMDARTQPAGRMQSGPGLHIGYWIGEPYWGHGYMTEAARGLIAFIFARRNDDVIYSGAFVDNAASLRVQDKLGFTREGEAMVFANPHRCEVPHVKTMLRRAWFEQPGAAARRNRIDDDRLTIVSEKPR